MPFAHRSAGKWVLAALAASAALTAQTAVRPRILGVAHYAIFAHDYENSRGVL